MRNLLDSASCRPACFFRFSGCLQTRLLHKHLKHHVDCGKEEEPEFHYHRASKNQTGNHMDQLQLSQKNPTKYVSAHCVILKGIGLRLNDGPLDETCLPEERRHESGKNPNQVGLHWHDFHVQIASSTDRDTNTDKHQHTHTHTHTHTQKHNANTQTLTLGLNSKHQVRFDSMNSHSCMIGSNSLKDLK